jgi:hypothetical protein
MTDAPQEYKQAGLFMLISGVMQIAIGLFSVLMGLSACVGTYGLCCFCPFLGALPIGLGVYELTIASQMQAGRPVPHAPQVNLFSLVVGVLTLAAVPVILEALAMANLGKPEVKAFLDAHAVPPELEGR